MTLGILGGCGPAAGAHFYSRLVSLTAAERDADHVDVLLSGRASTPDRTQSILSGDRRAEEVLLREGANLVRGGADLLVLLCHTAHAYLPALRAALSVPVLDMVALSVEEALLHGCHHLGVLCTAGTRYAEIYDRAAKPRGVDVLYPSPLVQEQLQSLIYQTLKRGRTDFGATLRTAISDLAALGADAVSLSCTELSLPAAMCPACAFSWQGGIRSMPIIDPVELLARRAITACGKRLKEKEKRHASVPLALDSCRRSPARGRMG